MTKYWKAVRKTKEKDVYETGGIGGSTTTQFRVGEVYEVEGEPVLCNNGFHFYRAKDFVFGIDLFGEDTDFIEVEPLGEVVSDTEKCVCCKIKVIRYVPRKERSKLIDKRRNSGNSNSGNRNSGNRNSGDRNSGNWNSGNSNSGNWNSGYSNSGNRNSGYSNSGNRNSGDWNSGNGYRNYVCDDTKYFLFNREVSKEVIDRVTRIDMSWFDLTDKTYHETWKSCPEKILRQWEKIAKELNCLDVFHSITGIK